MRARREDIAEVLTATINYALPNAASLVPQIVEVLLNDLTILERKDDIESELLRFVDPGEAALLRQLLQTIQPL